jgi:arylsulfatase A-like enzyme
MAHPNLLLITTDQQRGDTLGVDGNPVVRTPVLDRLARQGVYFTAAYSEAPVCVPMRSCWMLGRHPLTLGQNRWRARAFPPGETLTDALGAADYHCGVFGKRHFHPVREPYGFHEMKIHESGRMAEETDDDYFVWLRRHTDWGGYSRAHGVGNNDVFAAPSLIPEPEYISSWTARETTLFLERHAEQRPQRPFFCWCSFSKPHSPYDPPRPFDSMYRPQEVPGPYLLPGGIADELPVNQRRIHHYTWHTLSEAQMRASKAYYYGVISHIDLCVGRILRALDATGLRENTIVAFTSDHGDMMGDHHQYFKSTFYEGSARVPFIVHVPERLRPGLGVVREGAQAEPVGVSTLMPTLLDLVGVAKPATATADSLLPALRGGPAPAGGEVVGAYGLTPGGPSHSAMLRWEWFKYIYWQPGDHRQLFDVVADPGELANLAEQREYRHIADEAHDRLERRLAEFPFGRDEVLVHGKLTGAPFDPPANWSAPIHGPWGRRGF